MFSQRACMSWPLCAIVAATASKISMRLAASRPTLLYRLAASRMQIEPGWPPVACNMGKIGAHLLATGGHPRSICIRLAAKRQRRGGRLAASRMLAATLVLSACDWLPAAHYFSAVWQPVGCKLNQVRSIFYSSLHSQLKNS